MITKAYADTADGQIHFRRTFGGTGLPLVLLHMNGSSSRAFEPLMTLLAGKVPTIALDMMNYGESFATSRDASIEYIARVLSEALDSIGIDRFHAFGHHAGASVVVEMGRASPQRLMSATLNGITFATPAEMAPFTLKLAMPNPVDIRGLQLMAAWSRIKDNANLAPDVETPNAAEIMHRDVTDMLRAGENWHWGYQAVFRYDAVTAMKSLRCPIFFVSGRRDLSFPYHVRAMQAFPQALSYEHSEGGVYWIESHPADLASGIIEFLDHAEAQMRL